MKKKDLGKVNRSYDGIDRQERTAGLMALRIFVVFVMLVFIVGTAVLFAYNFRKEAENPPPSVAESSDSDGAYYQIFSSDDEEELLKYCSEFYPVSEKVEPKLYIYNEKIKVNAIMKDSLDKMVEAAAKDGIRIEPVMGYMTHRECETHFHSLCLKFQDEGATAAEAEGKAAAIFPPAKENEYRTGMLIKVSDMESSDFETSNMYSWLFRNGINYGFINRYTEDKEEITGIEADLTVYRFVGTENAQKMRRFGMCLEEYYDYSMAR